MIWILRALSRLLGILPRQAVSLLGRHWGWVAWLCRRRRHEVEARIMDCLDVQQSEARRIVRGMYRNFGLTFAELLRIPHMSDEEALDRMCYDGLEAFEADPGAIAVVAHTGNWEMQAATAGLVLQRRLNIVVKSLKPASLDEWMHAARGRWGTRVFDRRGSARDLLKVLKAGENLGFILDQNAKRNWGIFVDFFGKPACTSDGLAQLAAISGRPIFPVFCHREEDGRLHVEFGEQIPGPQDRSEAEIHRVTQAATLAVENFIRRYPDQWIWMHRRWRTQPLPEQD